MKIEAKISRKRLLWQLLFLCLPAAGMMFVFLQTVTDYLPVFNNNQHVLQAVYFLVGILGACFFYSYRFRFLPSFLIVLLLFWIGNKLLDNFAMGEFDSFFWAVDFLLFRILFGLGWICGWGFSRARYFPAILAVCLLLIGVTLVARIGNVQFQYLVSTFGPLLIFSFYNIYMSELIRNTDEHQPKAWWRPLKGVIVFSCTMIALLSLVFFVFRKDFKAMEDEWGQGNSPHDDKHSMFEREADSTLKMKDKLQLQDRISRDSDGGGSSNAPIFVAYLDNFFPKTKIPNPLYFVTDYLTLFDDYTETFEADSLMPYNDLFSPDPSAIPLYFSAFDSTVLVNGMSTVYRKVVEAEVYKINGSPKEYTAPSTAFFCQPIAVKNELKDQFKSAYRAKMWVSDLNSAYFVYNNTKRDWKLQQFQEHRFELLRGVENFNDLDTAFLNYYTRFPANPAYDTIRGLAKKLIEEAKAETPIDQILTIRDYFMSGNEEGKSLFQYTDTPGPVPSGSRLLNFLLNDHRGYCAHFAGSTLFLLRACGIPSRLTVGYALVDRSSNNKGWYWVYAKQSHAWVQAFFPGYGWLDFDTTFGDVEQQEAPATDGTPPLDPQKAWFAGTGTILTIDTLAKAITFNLEKMMYRDLEYKLESPNSLLLDMSLAKIYRDSLMVRLSTLQVGEKGLAISFSEPEELPTHINPQDIQMILAHFPRPVPIDEFRMEVGGEKEKEAAPPVNDDTTPRGFNWTIFWYTLLILVLLLSITLFATPYIIYRIYSRRAKRITNAEKESYYAYRAAMYLLHQMGYLQEGLTPLQYARQKIDTEFGTSFEAFVATYLKTKYARQPLKVDESERILAFYKPFDQVVKARIHRRQRFFRFMNIYNTLDYFTAGR